MLAAAALHGSLVTWSTAETGPNTAYIVSPLFPPIFPSWIKQVLNYSWLKCQNEGKCERLEWKMGNNFLCSVEYQMFDISLDVFWIWNLFNLCNNDTFFIRENSRVTYQFHSSWIHNSEKLLISYIYFLSLFQCLDPDDDSDDARPLAESLLMAIADLLFCPDFTVRGHKKDGPVSPSVLGCPSVTPSVCMATATSFPEVPLLGLFVHLKDAR